MALKLEGAVDSRERAFFLTAALFSASCLAARSAALRFVRGAMDGAAMLLGRGRGLGTTGCDSEGVVEAGRLPMAEEARGTPFREARVFGAGKGDAAGLGDSEATVLATHCLRSWS